MTFPKAYLLLLLICICLTNSIFAQKTGGKLKSNDYTFEWGPDVRLKGDFPTDMLLYENGSFFTASTNRDILGFSTSYISKFDNKLDLVDSKVIRTKASDKKVSSNKQMGLLELGGEIYILEKEKISGSKQINYYMESVNKTTLEPSENKKLVFSIDYLKDSKREDDHVTITVNKENNFIAVYDQHETNKKENVATTVSILNASFEKKWSKTATLPIIGKETNEKVFKTYVDPASNFLLVAKVYKNAKKNDKDVVDGKLNYDYHIYAMGPDISNYKDISFNLDDKAITEVKLNSNKKGEVIVTGIYSDINTDKNRLGIPRGIFYCSLDVATGEIKARNYKEFPKETYTAGLKGSKAEKALKKVEEDKNLGYTFEVRDLIPRADGGSTMIAEEYNLQIRTSSRGPGIGIGAVSVSSTSSTWEYTYKNIIIAKISENGAFEWISVIPKFQVTTSNHEWRTNTPASFILYDHKNDSYSIFFNDHKENLIPSKKAEGIQKVVNQKQSILVNMKVDAQGNVSKKTIAVKLPKDDEKTHFYPVLSFMPLGEKDIILYGTESSHDKFARIHFEN